MEDAAATKHILKQPNQNISCITQGISDLGVMPCTSRTEGHVRLPRVSSVEYSRSHRMTSRSTQILSCVAPKSYSNHARIHYITREQIFHLIRSHYVSPSEITSNAAHHARRIHTLSKRIQCPLLLSIHYTVVSNWQLTISRKFMTLHQISLCSAHLPNIIIFPHDYGRPPASVHLPD